MIHFRKMNLYDLDQFKIWVYTSHVAKWYHDPLDWIEEVKKQESDFHWLHHYIVELKGKPIGFCQYYACEDSDELWEGYTALGGSYSMDYMIGEKEYLRKGLGKQIVLGLLEKIRRHEDAKRVVVQPEEENEASCGLLLSCGFTLDTEKGIYVYDLSV